MEKHPVINGPDKKSRVDMLHTVMNSLGDAFRTSNKYPDTQSECTEKLPENGMDQQFQFAPNNIIYYLKNI